MTRDIAPLQLEIKQFLERVYGLRVAAIQTVNYEGKKKRRKTGYFLRPGYKKVEPCSPFFAGKFPPKHLLTSPLKRYSLKISLTFPDL
jgi:hypothetical protein